MIPLRSEEGLRSFPKSTLAFVFLFLFFYLGSLFFPVYELFAIKKISNLWTWRLILSPFCFPSFIHFFVCSLYFWVFAGVVAERRGFLFSLLMAYSGVVTSVGLYLTVHPQYVGGIGGSEAFVGTILGVFMRRDIWGNVETWVLGLGWTRVFLVPSYVLLFFWFFYLMIANLFLDPPLSEAPMIYGIHIISFLWGFFLESIFKVSLRSRY